MSLGNLAAVPNVTTLSKADAIAKLRGRPNYFSIQDRRPVHHRGPAEVGMVLDQDPAGRSTVGSATDTTITIYRG